jgi:hypothetical protein
MHVGFARVIWAEYIAGYFITDRVMCARVELNILTHTASNPFAESLFSERSFRQP